MKEKRGITLIALIITIIVLLIFAGVTISAVIGESGIITKASKAKRQTDIATEKESVQLAMLDLKVDDKGNTVTVTAEQLYDYMIKNSAIKPERVEEGEIPNSLIVILDKNRDNRTYTILQDGKIIENKVTENKVTAQTISDPDFFIFNEETGVIEGFANTETETYYYYQTNGWYVNVEPLEYEVEDEDGNVTIETSLDVIIEVPEKINGVTVIGIADHAFTSHEHNGAEYYGFENIVEIKLPETIEYIGNFAFSANTNLRRINIPSNVEYIGEYAFIKCASLSSVQLPNGLTIINEGMFENCTSLSKVIIPNTVEIIEGYAFSGCESLINVELSNSLISIGEFAFSDCDSLVNIVIPASVEIMENCVFYYCVNLNVIYCESQSQPSGWDSDWARKEFNKIYYSIEWGYSAN